MVKDTIEFPDFVKLDIRVGKVLQAEVVKGSQNLIRMSVDLGPDYGVKIIFSGIARWYKPSQLRDRNFAFIANLAPKKMMGEESYGMMLAADNDGKAVIIPLSKKLQIGSIIR